jgi:hypothetical protein
MILDLKPGRSRDGSIDFAFYKARAQRLRQEAMTELIGQAFRHVVGWIGRLTHSGSRHGLTAIKPPRSRRVVARSKISGPDLPGAPS